MTVDQTAAIMLDASRVFDRETDPELAAAALPASLKTMEGFLEASPHQTDLLRMLAEGYMSYAFGFLEDRAERLQDDDPDQAELLRGRALRLHLRARDFGLRLLFETAPEMAIALSERRMPTAAELAAVASNDVAGLYWTASPWAAAINVGKSEPALLAELQLVRALLERCVTLDEAYYHAAPRMTMGALEAGLPKALGGRPEAAKEHFERAVQLTAGKHLMTRVLYAKLVGVQAGDRALFESGLRAVLEQSPDIDPSLGLAKRLAQGRARHYLRHAEDWFLD